MIGYRASIFFSLGLVLSLTSSTYGQTPGEFEVRFDTSSLTTQQAADLTPSLEASSNFWESIIIGYQPGVTLAGLDLAVSVNNIDGPSGIIAQAGPSGNLFSQAGFSFATDFDPDNNPNGPVSLTGTVEIDTADFNTDLIVDVLNHEVAHTLGFIDLLFDLNDLVTTDGEFIGAEGLAAFQAEFDSSATFVPLTLDNAHLVEDNSITDAFGRRLGDELLSPIVENTTNFDDPNSNFLSNTSVGIFRDLGFNAVAPAVAAVPEASTLTALALVGIALVTTRRRVTS